MLCYCVGIGSIMFIVLRSMINPELLAEIQGLAVIEPVEKVAMWRMSFLYLIC